MLARIFYINQQGQRKNIEDNLFPAPGLAGLNDRVFLVCDGVGGQSKGEEASRIACETMGPWLASRPENLLDSLAFRDAAIAAVDAMNDFAEANTQASRMSTTLTAACLGTKGVWIAWCGDSRVYHIRQGKVLWQTKDHSLVQQLVEHGEISMEEAKHHPRKNVILRSITANAPSPVIDTHFISDVREGDYLLLCTDGLLEHMDEAELEHMLGPDNLEKDKAKLFLAHCEGRTNDNYSMYLLQFSAMAPARISRAVTDSIGTQKPEGKRKFLIAAILLSIAAIFLLWAGYWFWQRNASGGLSNQQKQPIVDSTVAVETKQSSGAIALPVLPQSALKKTKIDPAKQPSDAEKKKSNEMTEDVSEKTKEKVKPVPKAVMPSKDSVPG